MTLLLNRLPLDERGAELSIGLERVSVKPFQIVAWASLTPKTVLELPSNAPRFPVIFDTGHNHYFSIGARHLRKWAILTESSLRRLGKIKEGGQTVPLHDAAVWIHANVPGKRDWMSAVSPLRLHSTEGIAIYPEASEKPRLPLIGLRALARHQLHLTVDCERREVHLRTPDWRTRLLRWFM
jgi:hypothetical protein